MTGSWFDHGADDDCIEPGGFCSAEDFVPFVGYEDPAAHCTPMMVGKCQIEAPWRRPLADGLLDEDDDGDDEDDELFLSEERPY